MLSFWSCLLNLFFCISELNKGKVKIKKENPHKTRVYAGFPYYVGWLCNLECEFFLFSILSHQNRVAIL